MSDYHDTVDAMERYPGKHLFIDDFFIESLVGVRRVLHRPDKVTEDQPFDIPLDRPWEQGTTQFAGVVYNEVDRCFRLYYRAWHAGDVLLCALDSENGLEWRRPRLGLVEFDGSRDNNITNCPPGYLALLWDPHEQDKECRWKRIDNKPTHTTPDGRPVWQAFHSADGYDWHPYPPGPYNDQRMLFNFGSPAETFGGSIDPDAPYVHYSQRGSGRRTRVLGRRDSQDFLTWSGLRTVIDQDLDDPPGTEFYSAGFDPANRTEGGLHILMLHTFLTDLTEPYAIADSERYWGSGERGPRAIAARIDGFVEIQLAVSRDTLSWKRFREPLVPRGRPGAWDWGMLFADAPIRHEDRLWFFYTGTCLTHGGRSPRMWEKPYSKSGMWGKGVALLRPDGYVSVEATSFAPGVLTTHRFRQESGGTLRVNVDAAAGELRYELLEDTGASIPGFSAAECDPIRRDDLNAELSWRGMPGWPPLDEARRATVPDLSAGDFYVKLRFYIAPGTRLYSVTLDPPEVTMWQARIKGRVD